ncbi:MAG: TldD/PmbA family protein [Candidatus Micrarchaeota archaeon]|nr:TldD/PmbA family protein [Candidatus Micrarchaeota archaeon]
MLDKFLSVAGRAGGYLEFRLVSGPFSQVQLKDGEFRITSNESFGFSVRALANGSWGFASSNKEKDLEECVERAVSLAKLSKGSSKLSEQKAHTGSVRAVHQQDSSKIEIAVKVEDLAELEKSMRAAGSNSTAINYVDWNLKTEFANSEGSRISQEDSRVFLSMTAIARRGNVIQSASERISSSKGYDAVKAAFPLASSAAERAKDLLDASLPPSGAFPVIMDGMVTGLLCHEVVGHACEADAHLSHNSIFEGKIGRKLAPERVTIVDDKDAEWGSGSYKYDEEGVMGNKTKLIERGVLTSLLHSRETANAFKTNSTGNARAGAYSDEPIVRMSNTYMQKGDASIGEIFDAKHAVYAKGFRGGSVTTKTGDFVFAAEEGWLIENGEKTKRLRDILLAGNIIDTLANIALVGKDFNHSPGFCGKMGQSVPVSDGGPHVRVSKMIIGGQG